MIVGARTGIPASISTARATIRRSPACCVPFQRHSLYFKHNGTSGLPLLFCNGWITTRRAYSVPASRKSDGKKTGGRGSEDDYDDMWDDDDLEEEEEGEEEGEEDIMDPFPKMNRWLQNKPSGFGVGKTYDLSLEEKLMEEIEQSRKAQLANINKLKNSTPQKEQQNQQHSPKKMQATEVAVGVSRVRVGNLPKKKNIHRDLKLMFEGSRDILSISPAVIGNKKTREPICKGFAYVDFRSKVAAERFIGKYSDQSITFGKVDKRIVCHIVNHSTSEESEAEQRLADVSKKSVYSGDKAAQGSHGSQMKNKADMGSLNRRISSQLIGDHLHMEDESIVSKETPGKPNHRDAADTASRHNSSVETQNKRPSRRKSEKKSNEKSKVGSLGSATRLKSKERTVLTGVFSKYSGKAVAALTEDK